MPTTSSSGCRSSPLAPRPPSPCRTSTLCAIPGATSSRAASSRSSSRPADRRHRLLPLQLRLASRATRRVADRPDPADTTASPRRSPRPASPTSSRTAAPRSTSARASSRKARVALASKGVGPGGHVGFELFDKTRASARPTSSSGSTTSAALEGEIARTIEQIDGVTGADVQLVLPAGHALRRTRRPQATRGGAPHRQRHARPRRPSPASRTSSPRASRASTRTTSRSPTDLGQLLWPAAGAGGAAATSAPPRSSPSSRRYDAQLAAEINTMLARTLGPDKAQARVHAQLDLNQVDQRLGHVRRQRRAARRAEGRREAERKRHGRRPAWPAPAATSRRSTRTAPAARAVRLELHAQVRHDHVRRRTRRSRTRPSRPARSRSSTSRSSSTRRSSRLRSRPSRTRSPAWSGSIPSRGDTLTTVSRAVHQDPRRPARPSAGPLGVPLSIMDIVKYVVGGIGSVVFLFLVRRA